MKVAVISYDIKYVQKLQESMKEVEVLPYADTISFLKNIESNKPDLVVYDTTSGIFAEDDLRYLLNKGLFEDKKIYALTSPENPIETSIFEGKVIFFDKNNQIGDLVSSIMSTKPMEEKYSLKKDEFSATEEDNKWHTKEPEDFTDTKHIDNLDNTFQIEDMVFTSESNIKIEPSKELEPTVFDLDIGYETKQHDKKDSIFDLTFDDKTTEKQNELETFEDLTSFKDLLEPHIDPQIEEPKFKETKENLDKISLPKSTDKKIGVNELIKNSEYNNKSNDKKEFTIYGGKKMIANFNIQISEEEVKKLALQMVRDFLEKDPAMEKIIDYLQIDFQEEARRELENLKNELKQQLRREVREKMSMEIERLIKGELKGYVAEITARIVKEKIEQIFRVS